MGKIKLAILSVIIISFGVGAYFYPIMPELMASHWNAYGDVDGYMSKPWGLFFMPILSVILFLLLVFVPRIDPLKDNIEKFRKYYEGFILLIILFLFYIYMLTIFWNLGRVLDIGKMMAPAIALLFYYCGVLVEKAEKNWSIGIRNPWTLSSDAVWKKTHVMGGKIFKISGLIALLGIFFSDWAFLLMLIPVFFIVFYLNLYSYIIFRQEKSN